MRHAPFRTDSFVKTSILIKVHFVIVGVGESVWRIVHIDLSILSLLQLCLLAIEIGSSKVLNVVGLDLIGLFGDDAPDTAPSRCVIYGRGDCQVERTPHCIIVSNRCVQGRLHDLRHNILLLL